MCSLTVPPFKACVVVKFREKPMTWNQCVYNYSREWWQKIFKELSSEIRKALSIEDILFSLHLCLSLLWFCVTHQHFLFLAFPHSFQMICGCFISAESRAHLF